LSHSQHNISWWKGLCTLHGLTEKKKARVFSRSKYGQMLPLHHFTYYQYSTSQPEHDHWNLCGCNPYCILRSTWSTPQLDLDLWGQSGPVFCWTWTGPGSDPVLQVLTQTLDSVDHSDHFSAKHLKMIQKWSQKWLLWTTLIYFQQLTRLLSIGRGPGFGGYLPHQIFSEFYIFYLRHYCNLLKLTSLAVSNTMNHDTIFQRPCFWGFCAQHYSSGKSEKNLKGLNHSLACLLPAKHE